MRRIVSNLKDLQWRILTLLSDKVMSLLMKVGLFLLVKRFGNKIRNSENLRKWLRNSNFIFAHLKLSYKSLNKVQKRNYATIRNNKVLWCPMYFTVMRRQFLKDGRRSNLSLSTISDF